MGNKKILTLIFLFLLVPGTLAFSEDFFNEGLAHINEGDYSLGIEKLESACPVLQTDTYNETIWKCNFNLAYAYEQMAGIWINGENTMYNKHLLNQSIYYYENAILISDLDKNKAQVSDLLLLAHIKIALGDYSDSITLLDDIEKRLNYQGLSIENLTGKKSDLVKDIYNRLYSIAIKNIEINEIKTNFGPFGFSYIQIMPKIIFESVNDFEIEVLNLTYEDIYGEEREKLYGSNNQFIFEKPILLKKQGIFPFDKYYAELGNIDPPLLREININNLILQPSPYQSKAIVKNDSIKIIIYRQSLTIILFLIFYILSLISIYLSNKSIKRMKSPSFKGKNFRGRWSFLIGSFSLLFSLISIFDPKSSINYLTIPLIIFYLITLFRIFLRYQKLKTKNTK